MKMIIFLNEIDGWNFVLFKKITIYSQKSV